MRATSAIEGTYLVRDETQPAPLGQTRPSCSVVVHRYRYGWVCTVCQPALGTTRLECEHIAAARSF
jgi:5-keto 4-deoxyuronate isomerase